MNVGAAIRYLESALGVPHAAFRMILIIISTAGVVHLCACFFWLTKELTNSEDELQAFLEGMNVRNQFLDKYVLGT